MPLEEVLCELSFSLEASRSVLKHHVHSFTVLQADLAQQWTQAIKTGQHMHPSGLRNTRLTMSEQVRGSIMYSGDLQASPTLQ